MASKERSNKHPEFTPAEGVPLEQLNYKLSEMLGTDFSGGLTQAAANATYADLLRYNGWSLPGEGRTVPIPDTIFDEEDITSIIRAIEAKTGRTYYSGYMRADPERRNIPPACTTCVP